MESQPSMVTENEKELGVEKQEQPLGEEWNQDNPMNFQIETTNEFSIEGSLESAAEEVQNKVHLECGTSRASEAREKSTSSANAKQYWIKQLVDIDDDSTLDWIDSGNPSDSLPEPDIQFDDDFTEIQPATDENKNTRMLTINQVRTLEQCLLTNYEIESVKFPTIRVPPCYMIKRVVDAIRAQLPEVEVKSVRIMGGFSSYVMCHKFRYNDLDILFHIDFPLEKRIPIFENIRGLILRILAELAKVFEPELQNQTLNLGELAQGYIQKSVVIPLAHEKDISKEDDCWSLVCLRNHQGRNLEFKFLKSLKRNFEFSTDSFQLILEDEYISRLCRIENLIEPLKQYEKEKKSKDNTEINDNTCGIRIDPSATLKDTSLPLVIPGVKVICLYHSFDDALNHLQQFKIEIYNPESLRGGGLLKYCYLRSIGFSDLNEDETFRNKSICSMICRFLITCHDPDIQYNHISKYLHTHFPTHHHDRILYLIELRRVAELCTLQNVQLVKNLIDIAERLIHMTEEHIRSQQNVVMGWNNREPRGYPQPHQIRPSNHYQAQQRQWQMQPVQNYRMNQPRRNFGPRNPPPHFHVVSNRQGANVQYQGVSPMMNRGFPVRLQQAQHPHHRRTPPPPQRHQEEMQHHFQQGYGNNGMNNYVPTRNRSFTEVRNANPHHRDREVYRLREDYPHHQYVINEGPTHRRLEDRAGWDGSRHDSHAN